MILVTRLGGRSKFWLNENLIEFVEETPDTVVSMATGRKVIVAETAAELNRMIAENAVEEKVSLAGTFCMGNCQNGVCVTVDEEFHSVTPETVAEFFRTEVLEKV